MGYNKKALLSAAAFVVSMAALAQNAPADPTNEGFMRSEGKIYVVMAVVVTILAGLLLYVVRLDRKITKLEKRELI